MTPSLAPARAAPVPKALDITDHAVSEPTLRRWLSALGRPANLPDRELTDLLERHGRLPSPLSAVAAGDAIRDLLVQAIERLRPEPGVPRAQQVPYLVLTLCFVDGLKCVSAADRLGISPRHLTRERARAIKLLLDQLNAMGADPVHAPLPNEQIPAIAGYLPRPSVTRRLVEQLAADRLVHVHGPRGIGKTSLVAEFAVERSRRIPVLWLRFRAGVNTSLGALEFELGEYLRQHGRPALADHLAGVPADLALASRIAMRDLAGRSQLLVFDDYHLAEVDPAIAGFVEEVVARLPDLRVVTVGRNAGTAPRIGSTLAVPPLTRLEAQELFGVLGVEVGPVLAGSIHSWTEGLPHLVSLAAAWLKTASPGDVDAGIASLSRHEQVQEFLLDAISEVLDHADRVILDAASVFREQFTDEGLAYVANLTFGAVEDVSRRLVRRHLASRGRHGVAFFHASIREYFYARLEPDRRGALHARAAEWYAKAGHARESGYHRERAGLVDVR